MIDGIIVVNKEKNMTSRDVVNSLCHIFHNNKIGHTGTLDPLATGVLVCTIGKATKLVDYLTCNDKEYIAEMKLGIKTDTYDITGKILSTSDKKVNDDLIRKVFSSYNKTYEQEVPIYSSVKINGKKLYEYARNNEYVQLPKRNVTISNLEIIDINSDLITFKCHVTKGTYIRSLINDIGNDLGTYATMTNLQRTKQGIFKVEDAYNLSEIENNDYKIITIEELFIDYPKYDINDDEIKRIQNGNLINKQNFSYLRMYYHDKLIAIYEENDCNMRPLIML